MKQVSYKVRVLKGYKYQKYRVKLQGKFRREYIQKYIQERKKMVDFPDSYVSSVYKHDYLQYVFRRKVRIAYCSESNLRVYYTVDFRDYLLCMLSIHIRRIEPSRACMVVRDVQSELGSSTEDVSRSEQGEVQVNRQKIDGLRNYTLPSAFQAYSYEERWVYGYRN